MLRALLYGLTANMPCKLISRDGSPYLERYFVRQLGERRIYLHRFVSGDGDVEVHDHPWNAVSICLVGGYLEERVRCLSPEGGWISHHRQIFPGRPNRIRAGDFHRIRHTERDTWTLIITGPLVRRRCGRPKGWGFLRAQFAETSSLETHYPTVTYYQPFQMTHDREWWLDAPLGRDAGRAPLYRPGREVRA
ncbi:hypothetical protein J2T57_002642 [Natronocella acetinitrilica]|uniref:Cysteine dioxygenase n=1 Tax=Natronocella acetinitrilica TaxID=414046 RepID=A0AAE3G813_9GAMM|nr:hypothetical protein [Natronocella acetinitrilica]MCP1675492.1 hypothetical protein [Natronocella acetinitrilica]